MKVSIIDTGYFKLDGGAMFGVVPRQMWERLNPPDEKNMCTWAMRCLLIETNDRKILVDCGIGDKQDEKFRSHFEPHGEDSLVQSLKKNGLHAEDITDVFLTHLHFDHVGGAVKRTKDGSLKPTFPNATYWTNQIHWENALHPNPREKASFLKENLLPLQEAGVLEFIELQESGKTDWIEGLQISIANGHTQGMMCLYIPLEKQTLVYCADLVPSSYHIGIPYIMSYDVQPLLSMQEKRDLLDEAIEHDYLLFFEHDPVYAAATVIKNERGKYKAKQKYNRIDSLEI